MSKYFLSFLFLFSLEIISEDITSINIGEEWFLDSRSNKLSPTNSKVLYFMPNDAYHTHRARQFGDWDVFSIVDDSDDTITSNIQIPSEMKHETTLPGSMKHSKKNRLHEFQKHCCFIVELERISVPAW